MNKVVRGFLVPTLKIQRQITRSVSSKDVEIKKEELERRPNRFNFSQRFVPLDIQEYIKKNIDVVERLTVVEGRTTFTVELYTFQSSSSGINSYVGHNSHVNRHKRIIEALAITVGMSRWSLCGLEHSHVVIKLFDVNAPKWFKMDGQPITPSQVNSAYTTPCRFFDRNEKDAKLEVVIFRREEWTKVLFHELMHLYSYDISSNDKRVNTRLSHIFHVKCDFNLTEAYAEFWARVLWVLWDTQSVNGVDNRRFMTEMERQLEWSIRQGLLVLTNMGLTGNVLGRQLLSNALDERVMSGIPVCRETTASFSYYVICGFMMTEWECVLAWCNDTNTFPLLFTGGFHHVNSFITLLRELVNEDYVIEDWQDQLRKVLSLSRGKSVTARMTRA